MPGKRDNYDILGVSRSASTDQIKRSYRRLAKKYHPDRNPGNPSAEARFKEVQHAYAVLSDADKRAQYDRFGEVGVGQWNTRPSGQRVYRWGGSTVGREDLEDLFSVFGGGGGSSIFEELFGGGAGRRGRGPSTVQAAPQRTPDLEQTVELSFDQAVRGATLTLKLRSGADGRLQTIEVKVPPGVEEGQRLRLRGRVSGGNGRPPGDLYLNCTIKPHPYFTRRKADIYVDVPVSLAEAALGAKIEVPSIDGPATLTLPPGTAGGTRLRLKGCGIRRPGSDRRGDQYVVIRIVPPKVLTDEQRRLLEELSRHDRSNPRADCPWAGGSSSSC